MSLEVLLKKYDHKCELNVDDDEILTFEKNARWGIWKYVLIDVMHPYTMTYCRSQHELYKQMRRHFKENKYCLHPLSLIRQWWEVFMILVTLFLIIRIPYTEAFVLLPNLTGINYIQFQPRITLDVLCMIDIIINFRTAYYDDDWKIHYYSKNIAKNYLRTYFIFDYLSCLPPTTITKFHKKFQYETKVMYFTNVVITQMKFFRLVSLIRYLNNTSKVFDIKMFNTRMVSIAVILMFGVHWLSCLGITVSTATNGLLANPNPIRESWLTHGRLWNTSCAQVYTKSFYRSMCITFGSSYSTFGRRTVGDVILMCISWVVTRVLYTWILCLLLHFIRMKTVAHSKYHEMKQELLKFLQHKRLPMNIQRRFMSFFEFRYTGRFALEKEVFDAISPVLRLEIRMARSLQMIENVPLFKGLPQPLIRQLAMSLTRVVFLPGDIIFKSNTYSTSMYFIRTGTVSIRMGLGAEVAKYYDGEYFGEIELINPLIPRIASAIAMEYCDVLRLDRNDFIEIISPYQYLMRSIQQVAAERQMFIQTNDRRNKRIQQEKSFMKGQMI